MRSRIKNEKAINNKAKGLTVGMVKSEVEQIPLN